jgi:hypothetical protein
MLRRRRRTLSAVVVVAILGLGLTSDSGSWSYAPTGQASPTPTPHPIPPVDGLWISSAELAALPTQGQAWDALSAMVDRGLGDPVDVSDQESQHAPRTFAAALVAARVGGDLVGTVRDAIEGVIGTEFGDDGGHGDANRVLAWGRNVGSYVMAADLIDLSTLDPVLDERFRAWLRTMLTATSIPDAADRYSLRGLDATDPGNWGAWCGASHTAIAAYLRDPAELELARSSLERFLTTGEGFVYRDTWAISRDEDGWSTVPDRSGPIPPVNPLGARIEGHDVDGVVVADMRRGSERFRWKPRFTTYPREALSGRVIQAEILRRLGADPFGWGDQGLKRIAVRLIALEDETGKDWYEADQAPMWILRERYPSAGLEVIGPVVGRMIVGTDWTHPVSP